MASASGRVGDSHGARSRSVWIVVNPQLHLLDVVLVGVLESWLQLWRGCSCVDSKGDRVVLRNIGVRSLRLQLLL